MDVIGEGERFERDLRLEGRVPEMREEITQGTIRE